MTIRRAVLLAAAPALLLAACAAPDQPGSPGAAPTGVPTAIAAPGEVLGQGTVLQQDGEDPQFCLGGVMESYPPQCAGPVVVGWSWPDDGMWESASGVTWGTYALTGTWDGTAFTLTQPAIPLALYDPMMMQPDPRTDPANAGATADDDLLDIQEDLAAWTDVTVLSSYPENGYLWVGVVYDDGSIQSYLDEVYGLDVVIVQPVLVDLPAA